MINIQLGQTVGMVAQLLVVEDPKLHMAVVEVLLPMAVGVFNLDVVVVGKRTAVVGKRTAVVVVGKRRVVVVAEVKNLLINLLLSWTKNWKATMRKQWIHLNCSSAHCFKTGKTQVVWNMKAPTCFDLMTETNLLGILLFIRLYGHFYLSLMRLYLIYLNLLSNCWCVVYVFFFVSES